MRKICLLLTAATFCASTAFAQTETEKEKKQHEVACIAGTVSGVLLGAAVGGIFGGGIGKTLMEVAGGGGGGFLGHKLTCKKQS